jgi:hypothetical protein
MENPYDANKKRRKEFLREKDEELNHKKQKLINERSQSDPELVKFLAEREKMVKEQRRGEGGDHKDFFFFSSYIYRS